MTAGLGGSSSASSGGGGGSPGTAAPAAGPPAPPPGTLVDCNDPQSLYFKSKTASCKPEPGQLVAQTTYGPDGRIDKLAEGPKLWTMLVGYTAAEATARARQAGHRGAITVRAQRDYDQACGRDLVCRIDPYRWEYNLGDFELTLYINPKVAISTPE